LRGVAKIRICAESLHQIPHTVPCIALVSIMSIEGRLLNVFAENFLLGLGNEVSLRDNGHVGLSNHRGHFQR